MNNKKTAGFSHVLGLVLATTLVSMNGPLHADDTEIYTAALEGGFSEFVRPNVLYVIDTSGSMENKFEFDPALWHEGPYDPQFIYPGACRTDRFYYVRMSSSQLTSDGSLQFGTHGYPVDDNGETVMPGCIEDNRYFSAANMVCEAAQSDLYGKGWYFDVWEEHVESEDDDGNTSFNWSLLSAFRRDVNLPRECDDDWGLHGASDASAATYAANNEDGWATLESDSDAERFTASNKYLVVNGNLANWFSVQTRLGIVQIALRNVFVDLPDHVNVGLMRFDSAAGSSGSDGGMMIKEFDRAGNGNHREELVDALMSIPPYALNAATPLAETLLEALYVFSGSRVYWGKGSEDDDGNPFPSVPASRLPDNPDYYISPITESCQQNSIVYMTDGAADSDNDAIDGTNTIDGNAGWSGGINTLGAALPLPVMPDYADYLVPVPTADPTEFLHCGGNDECLPTLTNYLRHADIAPHVSGVQNVTTHTIGFRAATSGDGPQPEFLQLAADVGGGKFSLVTDGDQLEEAFRVMTREAVVANTAFTAPALAVNAFNRTRDENRIYFAMFRSSLTPGWGGNLKAYQFGQDNNGDLAIVDANNKVAIHATSGQFVFDAHSIWSPTSDGNDVPKGGAASNLPPSAARNLYTWFGGTDKNLRIESHAFVADNAAITDAMLGMNESDSDELRNNLINWLRGDDLRNEDGDDSTTQRLHMGDPLHSQPVVVTYGTSEENPDQRIFVTTNDGVLHVIDAATGQETFGFIAEESLRNAKRLFTNDASNGKVYGLDGAPVLYIDEAGTDEPGISGGDRVYLYTGMRRGGRNYYAFDITNPEYPKILWRIQGGDPDLNPDYQHLGYTFSTPSVGEIRIGGEAKKILVFGGGYDLDQDRPAGVGSTQDSYLADDYGNGVYIVDALTGTLLWRAGPLGSGANLLIDEMVNSIPSDVALVDSDNDGWSDRIYVGDTGGRVFRIDINEFNESGVQGSGGMIADLGASGVSGAMIEENVRNNRKFFYAPDISMVENGVNDYLAIAIGSGNRAHPSYPITGGTATQDVFFVLKDPHILDRPDSYNYGIVFDEDADDNVLFNVGTNGLLSDDAGTRAAAEAALAARKGWYLKMEHEGEKILAESTTFDYTVMFTSFEPQDIDLVTCQARTGIGRLYALNLRNGNPVYDYDGSEDLSGSDRSYVLVRDGIPPAPTLAFPEYNNGKGVTLVGPETPPGKEPVNFRRSYWLIPEAEETP